MSVRDIIAEGLAGGWSAIDAATADLQPVYEADVVVIGTGAGGGTTAEILTQAGLRVIMVEEGTLPSLRDFKMDELSAYPLLYQEAMSRTTLDGAIAIMQGRIVGGSTTVNWTSSFRTPTETLQHWTEVHKLKGFTPEAMQPWFEDREKRLNISPWLVPPNANNALLARGCEKLGWHAAVIPRNVVGCWNLGYCGMGCPANAKQSMLVTTVPGALDRGAQLFYNLRAQRFHFKQDRIDALECWAVDPASTDPNGRKVTLKAPHFVLAGSAIGSPGLLLRSQAPDPYARLGKRTFLHPVNISLATMDEAVDPYHGAPQSIYSDEFVWKYGTSGSKMGFKLEVPPLHPGLAASVLSLHGKELTETMANLPRLHATLALMRDGFHDESIGGQVVLRENGTPALEYEVTDYLWEGLRDAYLRMAEAQFAAGAKKVRLLHLDAGEYQSWSQAQAAIRDLKMAKYRTRLFTAHQMGGCAMGEDPRTSVVNSLGEHHQIANLNIIDASTFPTSIGANPQLSIYAMAAMQASRLAERLNASAAA